MIVMREEMIGEVSAILQTGFGSSGGSFTKASTSFLIMSIIMFREGSPTSNASGLLVRQWALSCATHGSRPRRVIWDPGIFSIPLEPFTHLSAPMMQAWPQHMTSSCPHSRPIRRQGTWRRSPRGHCSSGIACGTISSLFPRLCGSSRICCPYPMVEARNS